VDVAGARTRADGVWAEEPEAEDLVKEDKAWAEAEKAKALHKEAGDKVAEAEAEGEWKSD
jgi:hypothetical protein